jgi:hypothetical protein
VAIGTPGAANLRGAAVAASARKTHPILVRRRAS